MSMNEAAAFCQAARQSLTAGSFDQGIGQLQSAIGRDPRCFEAYELLGWAFLQRGQTDQAVQALSTAVGLNPAHHPVRINLAHALDRAGRTADAIAHLQHVLLQDPVNAQARQLMTTLQAKVPVATTLGQSPPAQNPVAPQTVSQPQNYQTTGPTYGYGQTASRSYAQPGITDYYSTDTTGWSPANAIEVILRPVEFFRNQASVRGFTQPMAYNAILSFAYLLVIMVAYLFQPTPTEKSPGVALIGAAFIFVIWQIWIFVVAGFNHLFCMMFGGQGGYQGTYRAVVYALTAAAVTGIIGGLMGIAHPILQILGGLLALAGWVWNTVLLIIGYREIHRMSTGSAVGAALLPGAIMVGLLILLYVVLFAALAAVFIGAAGSGSGGMPSSSFPR